MKNKTFDLGLMSKYRSQIYGITIIWIMLLHGIILDKVVVPKKYAFPDLIISHGNLGVDVFLFLAGVGMYFSFTKNSNLREYTWKRLVKILLPYICYAGIYYVYKDVFLRERWDVFFVDFSQISFIYRGAHLVWYVPGILLCYAIYPYLYSFFFEKKESNNIIRVSVLVVTYMLFLYAFFKSSPGVFGYTEILLTRIPIFMIGSAFGKAVYEKKQISIIWLIAGIASVVVGFALFNYCKLTIFEQRSLYIPMGIGTVFLFAWFFSIVTWKPLHKLLAWFGSYSLELYIVHICVRAYFYGSKYYTGNVWRRWLVVVLICIGIVAATGWLIQKLQKWILSKVIKKG